MALTWYSHEPTHITEDDILEVEKRLDVMFPLDYLSLLKEHDGGESEELEQMIALNDIENMTELGEYTCLGYLDEVELSRIIPIFCSLSGDYYAFDYTVLNDDDEPTIISIEHEEDELSAETITRYTSLSDLIASFE